MIVAHQGKHAAMLGGASEIGVAKHVAGAIDAGSLAVPNAENAVEPAFAAQFSLLRSPQRGRSQILVETPVKANVIRLEQRFGALELLVEPAERGAAIASDIARGVESCAAIPLLLHQA